MFETLTANLLFCHTQIFNSTVHKFNDYVNIVHAILFSTYNKLYKC